MYLVLALETDCFDDGISDRFDAHFLVLANWGIDYSQCNRQGTTFLGGIPLRIKGSTLS
jgi:hypothetical protein